jgi:ATP-dependent Lhr-like helicase
LAGNRLLFKDGLPVATFAAGEIRYLEEMPPKEQWEAQVALLRRHVPVVLDDLEASPAAP